jgi:hypothetical protein
MGWLLLVALGIMWAAFLFPALRRTPGSTVPRRTVPKRTVPRRTVEDFERSMDMLAETENGTQGRWIVTPGKGTTFIGSRARAQARARERRRRILVVMIEGVVLTGLIGLVPPLRGMLYATAMLLLALGAYVWLLLSMKVRHSGVRDGTPSSGSSAPARRGPARQRYAPDASSRTARPAYDGLPASSADPAPIVVRRASTVGAAGV